MIEYMTVVVDACCSIYDAKEKLDSEVMKYISKGWRPQGGSSLAVTDGVYVMMSQSLVRYYKV